MLKGIQGQNPIFLTDLSRIQNRISAANKEITSGYRINQAADDPRSISSILRLQGQIDHLTQTQTNLGNAKVQNEAADGALQSATAILDQLTSIASRGGTDTSTPETRALLADQVEQLAGQLVGIANATANGQYIFGGDDPTIAPYTFNWTGGTNGVVGHSTGSASGLLDDGTGSTISAGMSAADIFDSGATSIFAAVYGLGQALKANNVTGIQTALSSLRPAGTYLAQVSVSYGNRQNWIAQASDNASSQLSTLQASLASVRETDLPSAITRMTTDQTALQAAISAHASLSRKTLFDYFG
jgi:flagellin-like hook-associated protein FlgL